jgi:geranylgeranyl diphosphate synthase type II
MEALTEAVGFSGLTQGQMRDLRDGRGDRDEAGLRRVNQLKTSALFVAAVRGGGELGGGTPEQVSDLAAFGDAIGFAFQLCDDVLDATASVASTGKDVNQDREKTTFVDLWGVARVRAAINQSIAKAQAIVGAESALSQYVTGLFGNAGLLH